MKVVFMEEVEGTARVGDVKNVADGFARNYLLPRRLAAPATDHYIAIAQARAEKEARREARLDEEARQHLVPRVEGKAVTIEVRVGEQGKLFGSVTARDIAEALQSATRVELEHKQIDLRQPLRELGSHEVTVKLTRNVHVPVTVNVEPLGGMPETEEGAEAPEAAVEPQAEEAVAEAKEQAAGALTAAEEAMDEAAEAIEEAQEAVEEAETVEEVIEALDEAEEAADEVEDTIEDTKEAIEEGEDKEDTDK